MMNKKIFLPLLAVFFLPVFALRAEHIPASSEREKAPYHYHHHGLAIHLSLGTLWGQAEEKVWIGDHMGSQLTWKIKQAEIIRAEINHDTSSWLSVNLRGWTTLDGGRGKMDDYDWEDGAGSDWTHWSHHDDTPLNYANEWDISLRGWLLEKEHQHYRAGLVAGYQQNRASWTAYGGSYDYRTGPGAGVGDFPPGEAVAGYKQQYGAPYLGLVAYYVTGNVELSGIFKFSNWVLAEDYDEHYLRADSFYERSHNARLYSLSGNAGYYITKKTKLAVDLAYTKYEAKRASTTLLGTEKFCGDCGGMNSDNYTLSMGLSYLF